MLFSVLRANKTVHQNKIFGKGNPEKDTNGPRILILGSLLLVIKSGMMIFFEFVYLRLRMN